MGPNGSVDVWHGGHAFSIADKEVPIGGKFRMKEEGLDEIGSAIFGGIIDYDYLVIIVILIDDRLEVVLVAVVLGVVAGWDNNANR